MQNWRKVWTQCGRPAGKRQNVRACPEAVRPAHISGRARVCYRPPARCECPGRSNEFQPEFGRLPESRRHRSRNRRNKIFRTRKETRSRPLLRSRRNCTWRRVPQQSRKRETGLLSKRCGVSSDNCNPRLGVGSRQLLSRTWMRSAMGNPLIDGSQTGYLVLLLAGWRYSTRPTKCVGPGRSEGRVA